MINYYKNNEELQKICGASGRRFYFTVLLLLMQLVNMYPSRCCFSNLIPYAL